MCLVDRLSGQLGICGESDTMRIAWMGLHKGEEPPLTKEHGSGTIFFSGCPLHCRYCQNHQISRAGGEKPAIAVSEQALARLMIDLQYKGAANINLVTGTHYIPSIIAALEIARSIGLSIPIVWNSSGYESIEGLEAIDPLIDLYLIDAKTFDAKVAKDFCGTPRYVDHLDDMFSWLFSTHPVTYVDNHENLNGILIRHLLFPGTMDSTRQFLEWFAKRAKSHAWLSLMVQFVPPLQDHHFTEITQAEYDELLVILEKLEIDEGFVQELADNIPWIPDFSRDNPFPASFADPLEQFIAMKP